MSGCAKCGNDEEGAVGSDGLCVECRLRSHVSRLEESLRVALEERDEAVEVLREVEWDGALDDFVCPSCSQPKPNHFHDCRLARAIGKGE